ncbi:MAG: hypothetical protein WDA71_00080 [Actinomycetota bacterium]|jgi:hypothetical protein
MAKDGQKKATPSGDEARVSGGHATGKSPECLICPFGLAYMFMKEAGPEVMEHLLKAGFEVYQAGKAFMDVQGRHWDQAHGLQRIPVD